MRREPGAGRILWRESPELGSGALLVPLLARSLAEVRSATTTPTRTRCSSITGRADRIVKCVTVALAAGLALMTLLDAQLPLPGYGCGPR